MLYINTIGPDINYLNVGEKIKFEAVVNSSSTAAGPTTILGNETWSWDFGDSLVANTATGVGPYEITYWTEGTKTVTVTVTQGATSWSYSLSFNVYKIATEIIGPDYVSSTSTETFSVKAGAEQYKWYLNNQLQASSTETLSINFSGLLKAQIRVIITHGDKTSILDLLSKVTAPNSVVGKRYETDNSADFLFFNKEGDILNFDFIPTETGRNKWDGELLFHSNSNDTFKTIGLYLFEKVAPLKFQSELNLNKFQLFNEYGTDFIPKTEDSAIVENITPTINLNGFYTKWIHGVNFHRKFSKGTEVYFKNINSSTGAIVDFETGSYSTSGGYELKTFTVIDSKQGAVMVMTDTLNTNWESYDIENPGTIHSINAIRVWKSDDLNTFWNESGFEYFLYDKKKLSVVNSPKNEGVYTVNFFEDNDNQPLSKKWMRINCVNILDWDVTTTNLADRWLEIELKFKSNLIFLSDKLIDFIPQTSFSSLLNTKDLIIYENHPSLGEQTPKILKAGQEVIFEDDGSADPNLALKYKIIEIGNAIDVLDINDTDDKGWNVTVLDKSFANKKLDIYLTNINGNKLIQTIQSTLTTAEISAATKKSVAEEYYNESVGMTGFLMFYTANEEFVTIKSVPGWDITDIICENPTVVQIEELKEGTDLPLSGLIGGTTTTLSSTTLGFVYYRTLTGTIHIQVDWDSVNSKPIWYTIDKNKTVCWVSTTGSVLYERSISAISYLTNTVLKFREEWDNGQFINPNANEMLTIKEVIINRFVSKWKGVFDFYGLDLYTHDTELCVARSYTLHGADATDDYIDVSFNQALGTITSTVESFSAYQFMVLENINKEFLRSWGKYSTNMSQQWQRKIVVDDIDPETGFNLRINGIDFPVAFDDITTTLSADVDQTVDINETLTDWGNTIFGASQDTVLTNDNDVGKKYYKVLESIGVLVWLERSFENVAIDSSAGGFDPNTRPYDTIVLQSRYPNVHVEFDIFGTLGAHKVKHSDIEFINIGKVLTLTINGTKYTTDLSNESIYPSVESKIQAWIEEHSISLFELGILLKHNLSQSNLNVLEIYTIDDKTRLKYQIYVGLNPVPGQDFYIITSYQPGNQGLIISGNEVVSLSSSVDFQDAGFGTAMITSLSGSSWPLNNQEYNIVFLDPTKMGLSYQGPFWNSSELLGSSNSYIGFDWEILDDILDGTNGDTTPSNIISLNTREFLRFPREGYDETTPIKYKFSWLEDNTESIFYYDFSGNHLTDEGIYTYTGQKPLFLQGQVNLNSEPNRDITKINDSKWQQTIFEELTFTLEKIDSETDISPEPEPLQVFIGFKDDDEGVKKRTLLMHRVDDIKININTRKNITSLVKNLPIENYNNVITFIPDINEIRVERSTINFAEAGLRVGMNIKITGFDNTNKMNQAVFKNNGFVGEISAIGINYLRFKNPNNMKFETTWTQVQSPKPPYDLYSTGFDITISVEPTELARIKLWGETEIEDERFKVQLRNKGLDINPSDMFIFKEYDINESGIDWTYINAKRKELLRVHPEIYNYIGSYKAVINAINFFGYNDLIFNEYYRNNNKKSLKFGELKKVTIPDIFNPLIEGWNETDYIKDLLPNKEYIKTRLYNLTYKITDFEGNNILAYSIDEVITKLLGLKRWLQEKTIPIGHRILDITGEIETLDTVSISHQGYTIIDIESVQQLDPVSFTVEAYLQPVVNDSETYVVNIKPTCAGITPDWYHLKITTYSSDVDFTNSDFKLKSVKTINEYRTNLDKYNFSADRKIDPYIMIEASCENGYGASYKITKTYSLEKLAFL